MAKENPDSGKMTYAEVLSEEEGRLAELLKLYQGLYMDFTEACKQAGIPIEEGYELKDRYQSRFDIISNKLFDKLEGLLFQASLGEMDPIKLKGLNLPLMKWVLEKRRSGKWGTRVKIETEHSRAVDRVRIKNATASQIKKIKERTILIDNETGLPIHNKIQ